MKDLVVLNFGAAGLVSVHKSITQDRVLDACRSAMVGLDNPGFCLSCGADADGVEPDAEGYNCDNCGASAVTGAENALFLTGL